MAAGVVFKFLQSLTAVVVKCQLSRASGLRSNSTRSTVQVWVSMVTLTP